MSYLHMGIGLANILLLTVILYYFYQSYREVHSKFALGLVFFAAVLLLNGFFIFPMFLEMLAPAHACPYEPFYTIAGGFELLALTILLVIVRE